MGVDVGECIVGAEGAVTGGGAVPPDAHVSSLNYVVVARGGAIRVVCRRRRRPRPVPPQAPYPYRGSHARTSRVTGHVTVSGAKTSAYSAAATSCDVEARV